MIHDLRECKPSGLFYSGRAGQKEGVLIDGEPWIAKYPRTTRDLVGKRLPSYTSSPVSEYIGSHIFGSLGIPTHETILGYRNGKIVCACKDFTYPDGRLFEFKDIKNSLSPMTIKGLTAPLRMVRAYISAMSSPPSRHRRCCEGHQEYWSASGICSSWMHS